MLKNRDEAFKKISNNLPDWMNGRKRPEKSITGKMFSSMSDEQTELNKKLKEVIDTFFLTSYAGKEDSVLTKVYVAHTGFISPEDTVLVNVDATLTEDPNLFMNSTEYAIYQNGYIIIPVDKIEDQKSLYYNVKNYEYRADLIPKLIWNIFDEFAKFTGLERYDDETNYQLMQRCLAVFRRPTNGTENGLKNAVINAVMNYVAIDKDNIKIETPNEGNMYLKDTDGEIIYEKLAKENMDSMRTKLWDETDWTNSFAKIKFIPHEWDKIPAVYQDGTGNGNNLRPFIAKDIDDEKTDVSVTAYKKSKLLVDNYVRRHSIKKTIPIELRKYRDELRPQEVEYKINATKAIKLDPDSIFVKSQKTTNGLSEHNLSDIIIDPCELTSLGGGNLEPGSEYRIKIYPEKYSDFKIYKAEFRDKSGRITNLLTEQGDYILNNGVLTNKKIFAHIDSVKKLKASYNIKDADNGITMDEKGDEATFSFDVTGMGGQTLVIDEYCAMTDYTTEKTYVKSDGFTLLNSSSTWTSKDSGSEDTLTIELDCSKLSFDLAMNDDPKTQGSVMINYLVDGEPNSSMCGIWTKSKTFNASFGKIKHVKVTIRKMGQYPVSIKNIFAARYDISLSLDEGTVIQNKTTMRLSDFGDVKNTAHVTIRNYGTHLPSISYIHVGPLITDHYIIKSINKNGLGGTLSISTDSRCALYKIENGSEKLIDLNYNTRPGFKNKTNHSVTVPIDVSGFISISKSSRDITRQLYNGTMAHCITIGVGETVYTISIDGSTLMTKDRKSLSEILSLDAADEIYCASNADGFIVKHTETGKMQLVHISQNMLDRESDTFIYEGLPSNVHGVFIVDDEAKIQINNNKFDREFNKMYIVPYDRQVYIAYNKCNIVQSPTITTMADTFSPMVDTSANLLFYKIDKISIEGLDGEITAKFITGEKLQNWSLGKNSNIQIDYDKLGNESNCMYELYVLNETFEISNTIKLRPIYYIDEYDFTLARWIMTPPDDMQVEYIKKEAAENIVVKEDGFNKLYYSNIINIVYIKANDVVIDPNDYSLINKAGIIIWNTSKYTGQKVEVGYTYNYPTALAYKDIDSLYDTIGYSVDAYMPLNEEPIVYKRMKEGERRIITFNGQTPDKIAVTCSNPNFQCLVNGDEISVKRSDTTDKILVHSGYYYVGGQEYYAFESLNKESVKKKDTIKYSGVTKNVNSITCGQASDNLIKNSRFYCEGEYKPVCVIDPIENPEIIKGYETPALITSCESYQLWDAFEMDIDLVKSLNNNGIQFTPKTKNAYALLEITSLMKKGNTISFYASPELEISIMKEIAFSNDDRMRTTFCQQYDRITPVSADTKYRNYKINRVEDVRYYLMIQGTGQIDDIVSKKMSEGIDAVKNAHIKNIDSLGFNIEETAVNNSVHEIEFDKNKNVFDGLEMDGNGFVETGSNIEWGLTKIAEYRNDFSEFGVTGDAYIRHDYMATEDGTGSVISPKIIVPDYHSVKSAYIKVNDIVKDNFNNFKIIVRGCQSRTGKFTEIAVTKKGNIIEIPGAALKAYLQIVVEMDTQSVINSIEVHLKYAETPSYNLSITPNDYGTMTTKVYDMGAVGDWKFKGITGDFTNAEDIKLEIRGCRRNSRDYEWSRWYTCDMANETENHLFNDYRMFQFRLSISGAEAAIKINSFILEAI